MKTLYLVRHAKSSWATAAQADRDRPLNERGLHDVALMGQRLAERGVKPDVMLSSPATRAHTTARHIAKALGVKGKHIVEVERLYDATADQILGVVQVLGPKPRHVMVFGHNPGMSELAHRFASEITHMPTCAVAEFRFDVTSWAGVGDHKPAHVAFDFPKKG
jgi:phosphohistidine phosphatase